MPLLPPDRSGVLAQAFLPADAGWTVALLLALGVLTILTLLIGLLARKVWPERYIELTPGRHSEAGDDGVGAP